MDKQKEETDPRLSGETTMHVYQNHHYKPLFSLLNSSKIFTVTWKELQLQGLGGEFSMHGWR